MNQAVILSEAKDHLERIERRKMILRFAQDDRPFDPSGFREVHEKLRALPPAKVFPSLSPRRFQGFARRRFTRNSSCAIADGECEKAAALDLEARRTFDFRDG